MSGFFVHKYYVSKTYFYEHSAHVYKLVYFSQNDIEGLGYNLHLPVLSSKKKFKLQILHLL